jgi:hypothetical protein
VRRARLLPEGGVLDEVALLPLVTRLKNAVAAGNLARQKKQQMHWSLRGAHLLLQVRTRVLNDDLADDFRRWFPSFAHTSEPQTLAA